MSLGMTREQADAFLHRLAHAAEELAAELGIDTDDVGVNVNVRIRPAPELVELRFVPPPPGSTLN